VLGKILFHGVFDPGSYALHHLGLLAMFYDGVFGEKIPILIKVHGRIWLAGTNESCSRPVMGTV